jgi:uncharacterized protein (TIGR00251 family)
MTAGVILSVRVIPRSKKTEFGGMRGDALVVRVKAPPVEGAANAALIEFLARTLNVSRRAIQIRSGETARLKRVAIAGVTADAVRAAVTSRQPPPPRP